MNARAGGWAGGKCRVCPSVRAVLTFALILHRSSKTDGKTWSLLPSAPVTLTVGTWEKLENVGRGLVRWRDPSDRERHRPQGVPDSKVGDTFKRH